MHITSTNFDDPKLKEMTNRSQESISIHGFQGDKDIVYIGARIKNGAIHKKIRKEGFNVEKVQIILMAVLLKISSMKMTQVPEFNWRYLHLLENHFSKRQFKQKDERKHE